MNFTYGQRSGTMAAKFTNMNESKLYRTKMHHIQHLITSNSNFIRTTHIQTAHTETDDGHTHSGERKSHSLQ